jgi:GntR family transcriptional regulator, carbon starvation induced regulator
METPSSTKSLSTLAFERIHADIVAGVLQPNLRLRIQALSERYDTGASAIREALSRLTNHGLVGLEDQRGFFVAPISVRELRDLTDTRIELESIAIRKSIESGGLDWETAVLSAYHRLSRTPVPSSAGNWPEWSSAHQQFHDALIGGCGSPSLLRLCGQTLNQLERYRNLANQYTNAKTRGAAADEHQSLFDAAMTKDTALAQTLLAQHYTLTAKVVEDAVFAKDDTNKPS